VLALGAHNISQIAPGDILRPLLLSLLAAGAVFGLGRLFLGDWHRAALAATLVLLLFLSYGQVYAETKEITVSGSFPFRHRTLGVLWGILLVAGIFWAWRRLRNPADWTPWLNLIGVLLLVYPLLMIVPAALGTSMNRSATPGLARASVTTSNRPDVYYIILDAYGRQDALHEELGYDNSDFIEGLEQRGFYVAECSQSNYAQTELSLTSSLNYDYLQSPASPNSNLTPDDARMHSVVRTFFEEQGYQVVAFPTGFAWLEWTDADTYPRLPHQLGDLSEFEILFGRTTLLRIPMDLSIKSLVSAAENERYRERTLNVLSTLGKIPGYRGDYFVYAHIVSPHPPYVFDAEGNPVDLDTGDMSAREQQASYAEQATFIGHEVLKVVDEILQGSSVAPVIVIQGDHGSPFANPEQRMKILNAYYLPGAASDNPLYPSISPVNTFRVILDTYFGQRLPILDDASYFSNYDERNDFELIPNSCPEAP
jgi:hypothetical protein